MRSAPSPARIATFVAIPVALLAGGITAFALGSSDSPDAASSAGPSSSPVPVPDVTVPVDPATTAVCSTLVDGLPTRLNFGAARPVTGRATAAAWGDPPVVLVCGVATPATLTATSQLVQVNGVAWFVQTAIDTAAYGIPGENTLWTSVQRQANVGIVVSGTQDAASVVSPVSKVIARTVPEA